MTYYVGVDLGTTFTAAAVWRDGRVEVASLGMRAPVVPSVVMPRPDGTTLVGEPAERRAAVEPERVAREFKRRFGDPTPLILGGAPYSADALTARLLAWVVGKVAEAEGGPPAGVVVCHPANWGDFKQDLLGQAIARAELGVATSTVPEPEAAAVYYAAENRIRPGSIVAVYDLGGGTFDAAVLRRTDPEWEVLGEPQGVEHLGGIDFDEAVFRHTVTTLGLRLDAVDRDDPTSLAAMARLRRDCVEAKEALSADSDVTIPVLLPSLQHDVRLTRAELEEMMRPALTDTIAALRRALRAADVTPEDVQSVLLVGGSSRVPLVGQMVGSALGRPVAIDAHPKHGTALGAAILAAERATAGRAETHRLDPTAEPSEPTAATSAPPPAPAVAAAGLAAAETAEAAATEPTAPAAPITEAQPVAATPTPPPAAGPEPDAAGPVPPAPAGGSRGDDGDDPGAMPVAPAPAPGHRRRVLVAVGGILAVGALVAAAVALRPDDDSTDAGGDSAASGDSASSSDGGDCAPGDDRTVTELDDVTIPAVQVEEFHVDDVTLSGETIPGFTVDAVGIPEQVVDGGCIIEYTPSADNCLGAVEITWVEIPGVEVPGYEIPWAPSDDGDYEGEYVDGIVVEPVTVEGVSVDEVCADETTGPMTRDSLYRSSAYREAVYRSGAYRPPLCIDGECTDEVNVPDMTIDEVTLPEVTVESQEISP
jgi:actin-like ATPase involved in cell morphogenesis